MPFAARFGYTEDDLLRSPELDDTLKDVYARHYGHEPTENWILIVYPDDTSQFFSFADPADMWCCKYKREIQQMLQHEVSLLEAA